MAGGILPGHLRAICRGLGSALLGLGVVIAFIGEAIRVQSGAH